MTKIALYGPVIPDSIRHIQRKSHASDTRFDTRFLQQLEHLPTIDTTTSDSEQFYNLCKSNPEQLYALIIPTNTQTTAKKYAGWNTATQNIAIVTVMEYDETKPHIIGEYDGEEYIKELQPKFVDVKHNIWRIT